MMIVPRFFQRTAPSSSFGAARLDSFYHYLRKSSGAYTLAPCHPRLDSLTVFVLCPLLAEGRPY
ncbi:Protein of unknown function [Pyronema omphalodes CBS 100304]|uniref:Uncharacterized protein n=1 Tax=Pyronema omphalodes (strain CBS 100304) TaxID=1076935 RepID=U4L1B4_PYROM|nr:Protein of unknown function [Pyronema omphalodes CBS 100304]